MLTTAHTPSGSIASLPELPVVVRSSETSSFPDRKGALTAMATRTAGETMMRERPNVRVPRVMHRAEAASERFTLLQKWDGVVLDVDEETFTARLLDSHGALPSQQVTFSRTELSEEEQSQIAVGAPFVWTIGYRHIGASRHRDSTIYFRRLPAWTDSEIHTAHSRAEKLSTAIGWR